MLCFTAAAVVLPFGVSSMANAGPHGFSEALYLYTSQTGNNGSAFAGITGNTLWYNTTGGIAMLIGRYFIIIPMMAVAGSLVAKKIVPAVNRHLPDPWRALRRPAGRRDPDRRRPLLLPRARARADRRALRHDGWATLLIRSHFDGDVSFTQTDAGHGADRSQDRCAGDRLGLRQARSARHDEESR